MAMHTVESSPPDKITSDLVTPSARSSPTGGHPALGTVSRELDAAVRRLPQLDRGHVEAGRLERLPDGVGQQFRSGVVEQVVEIGVVVAVDDLALHDGTDVGEVDHDP